MIPGDDLEWPKFEAWQFYSGKVVVRRERVAAGVRPGIGSEHAQTRLRQTIQIGRIAVRVYGHRPKGCPQEQKITQERRQQSQAWTAED